MKTTKNIYGKSLSICCNVYEAIKNVYENYDYTVNGGVLSFNSNVTYVVYNND
jgi:hypothetical protein